MLRQGAAALHCIVDTTSPRTVPVKLLKNTSRMLNFDVSQSPNIVSSNLMMRTTERLTLVAFEVRTLGDFGTVSLGSLIYSAS